VASKANLGPQAATLNACAAIVRAAEITRSHDNLGRAEALIQKVINQTDVAPLYAIIATYWQAQIAVLVGRTENAQDYIDALLPYSGEVIRPNHLCVDEILGSLYGLIENFGSAKSHFQQALDYWSDDYKVNILRIQLKYADLLEQTQNADDRILASDLIDKAQQIARQIDARPYLERALSKRDILKA
jgi:tetratricopeptide (TPR) repeat protein